MDSRCQICAVMMVFLITSAVPNIVSGSSDDFEQEVNRICSDLGRSLQSEGVETVAILDLTDLQGNPTELGRYLAEEFVISLAQTKTVRVVDRANLRVILDEHKLSATGLLNPENAKKLGQIAGVGAFVIGTVTPLDRTVGLSVKAIATDSAVVVASARGTIPKTETVEILHARGIASDDISWHEDPELTYDSPAESPRILVGAIDSCENPWTREIFYRELQNALLQNDRVTAIQRATLPRSVQENLVKQVDRNGIVGVARKADATHVLVGRCVSLGQDCLLNVSCKLKALVHLELVDLRTGQEVDSKAFEGTEQSHHIHSMITASPEKAFQTIAHNASRTYMQRLNEVLP